MEILDAILRWAVPAVVVFGATAIALGVVIWSVRRARRSPRARAVAAAERSAAGGALVRLDDAVAELDLEVGLSGAMPDGAAPTALRRARLGAQHARDEAFAAFAQLRDDMSPPQLRRDAERIRSRAERATAQIDQARAAHVEWMRTHLSAAQQITAARERRDALHVQLGDPAALVDDLRGRFSPDEWADAAAAARAAVDALAAADRHLDVASATASDPSRSSLEELAAAERDLRRAQTAAQTLEETHRAVTEAARSVPGELDGARVLLRQALIVREGLDPVDAERLGDELRAATADLEAAELTAHERPSATIAALARLRLRVDLALGDARTAQQRLRGARTALPGSLAAARQAIAHAEPLVAVSGADARVRLAAAQDELAAARSTDDPVAALDAARRAIRHADDAHALAVVDRRAR